MQGGSPGGVAVPLLNPNRTYNRCVAINCWNLHAAAENVYKTEKAAFFRLSLVQRHRTKSYWGWISGIGRGGQGRQTGHLGIEQHQDSQDWPLMKRMKGSCNIWDDLDENTIARGLI